ncbi:MAG: MATE family efflux transporter, partial [Lachnospiraceae bacterium]|nr:MATE family efflux transporter [Lachnospiraceae bacterium]
PNLSFGNSMTTYTGQNVGAKRYDRVEKGSVQGAIMAVGVSTTITILILIFGKYLMGMFTTTEELINLGMSMMCILAPGYIAVALSQSLSGVMRGAGDTMTPMWISLITTVALRVPLAYGISYLTRTPELPTGRSECIFISLLVSWCVGALLNFIAYKRGGWKQKAVQ